MKGREETGDERKRREGSGGEESGIYWRGAEE